MPEAWTLGWYAARKFWPKKWREKMALNFRSDWIAGYAKARGQRAEGGGQKRTGPGGAGRPDGRTVAQARFELSRELAAVRERLDAQHDLGQEPEGGDRRREKEIEQLLKELDLCQ